MMDQIGKDKTWVEFLFKDLNRQKETIERAIEFNIATLNQNKQDTQNTDEEEKVTKLLSWWEELTDLIECKSPMVEQASKVLDQEDLSFKEKVLLVYSLPSVSQKEEVMQKVELARLFDQLPLDQLFDEISSKNQLTPEQELKLNAWLDTCSENLYDRTKHIVLDHYLEKGSRC